MYRGSEREALSHVDLSIKEGEIFGILGPNGAGKTTLFSVLCGILNPSSGQVQLCGLNLATQIEKIKRLIGIVPQDIALYPTISGMENLLYIGRMYGLNEKKLKERIGNYMELFGVMGEKNKIVNKYSGGTKRKFNLIAGLLHEPTLLLLDEPTVGVDVQTRLAIMSHLKQINASEKMTILYTSHYLEQAQNFCDRIGILNEGKLVKIDTPSNLLVQHDAGDLESVFLQLTNKYVQG